MTPTLLDKERLVAEKLSLKFKDLQRGEIVIFINPKYPEQQQKLIIKRVVGLPGETIDISGGKVYINEEELNEPYLEQQNITRGRSAIQEGTSYRVADDTYVLLGDNREHSRDSREWGAIKKDRIIGRALLVYYPFSNIHFVKPAQK
jgi:signal peptidase I